MASWEELQRRNNEEYRQAAERHRKRQEELRNEALREQNEKARFRERVKSVSGGGGGSYTGPSAPPIPTSRVIAILLAVALIVAGVMVVINYSSYYNGEWTYATADKQSSRTAEEYQNYLLSLDNEYARWNVTYESAPTTLWNYLLGFIKLDKAAGYTIGGYHLEDGDIYDYRFEGDDAGTGIPDGRYTLATLDGIHVLIDEDNETIYKEGTEFYETYAPKLRELTHDMALASILERTAGGEHAMHGSNDFWMEYICKDNSMVYSYMLSDDETKISGGEFRAITTYPEENTEERWCFAYGNDAYEPDDWEGFVYADNAALNTNDELGKLMQKSFDDNGHVVFYKGEEVVLRMRVDYFPDGYGFEIYDAVEDHDKGLAEDMFYRVNTTDKTLTKIENYDDSDELRTDMPLSEYQDLYDFLLSIVPHTYIRSLIDMDKAAVRKEKLGLITIYEMKDENGNVTADMKIMFGVIGEVIHYTAEGEYVMIELEY